MLVNNLFFMISSNKLDTVSHEKGLPRASPYLRHTAKDAEQSVKNLRNGAVANRYKLRHG
jgi:hypothetical protein